MITRRVLCFIVAFTVVLSMRAQMNVTFRVDMSNETVSSKGVHVAGDFQSEAGFGDDWQPGATPLTDPDGDGIYEVSVNIPSGTYLYKFVNGNSWQDQPEYPSIECGVSDGGGNINRQVTIGNMDIVLPVITFNECGSIMRLGVVMDGQVISDRGVYVMGNFQVAAGFDSDWDPAATPMFDKNQDGSYEIDLQVPPGTYQVVFVNGDQLEQAESITGPCTETTELELEARTITITESRSDRATYCFGECEECDPQLSTNYKTEWWNDAVFYEIFVRSFYDSDGDGIGDFQGLIEKLDYLNDGDPETTDDLGITGIWLMPMMSSPSYHGYDVTDYFQVEPDYGTMEDFEEFLDEAHQRGIKVIIDFVMNHSSDQHPWFQQSAAGQNGFQDWYIWRDNNPGFSGPWGQSVWHQRNGKYYYGLFWGGMPDLNYDSPEVRAEIFRSAEFWLDKGVDGFRLDAIKYLDEDGSNLENTPETFSILEDFNALYKSANADAVTVGEVWSNTTSIIPYVQDQRLDLCFDFDLASGILDAVNFNNPKRVSDQIKIIQENYPKLQYATFLTNHDINRVMNTLASTSKMKQAATLYLTLPGVPFIYYGEEVAMKGTKPDPDIRRPMQWSGDANGGFSTVTPWHPLGVDWQTNHVEGMSSDSNSILSHYRKLIHFRNNSEALRRGYLLNVDVIDGDAIAFARISGDDAVVTLTHFESIPFTPTISLAASTLPEGRYEVTDILTGQTAGMVDINENGGIDEWTPDGIVLNPRGNTILSFTPTSTVSTQGGPAGKSFDLKIFPNPANDLLNVQISDPIKSLTIEIISVDGKVVFSAERPGVVSIDISNYASGLYFARVVVDGILRTEPVYID